MLRDLTIVLSMALTSVVVSSACSSAEQCGDCCDLCSGGCGSNCGTTGAPPPDAGSICTGEEPKTVCTPGSVQACRSSTTPQAAPSCAKGQQTCNAAGTGYGVCDDVLPHPDGCDEASSWTCDGDAPTCGSADWATMIAGAGDDVPRALTVDAAGNAVLAISVGEGDVTLGATKLTFASPGHLLAKLDASGAPLWALALPNATSLAIAPDETGATYATGTSSGGLEVGGQAVSVGISGAYLAKIGPSGAVVWARGLTKPQSKNEPPNTFSPAAVAVVDGAPIVAGSYDALEVALDDVALPGSLEQDGFVARYDPTSGKAVWATQVSSNVDDTISAVAGDGSGDIVVGGHFDGDKSCPTPRLLYGRLHGDGSTAWVQRLDTPARITAIKAIGDSIFAAGAAAGPVRVGATLIDAPGFVVAVQGTDIGWYVPTTFQAADLVINAASDVIAAGVRPDRGAGLVKLDLVAQRFYEHAYAANPNPGAKSASISVDALGVTPDDGLVIAGAILGRTDLALGFGGVPIASTSGFDAFLARLDP